MRRFLKVWPLQRRHLPVQLRRLSPTEWQWHLPVPLICKLPQKQPGNWLWRGSPLVPQLVESIAPIPTCGGCRADPPSVRSHKLETMTTPPETPSSTQELEVVWQATPTPIYLGVMACLRSQSLEEYPRTIGRWSGVSSWGGDHVYKSHHQGWGYWGHLLGYGNHLGWESGPQWPWTGDSSPGAHDRRHERSHLKSNQIPTFWQ